MYDSVFPESLINPLVLPDKFKPLAAGPIILNSPFPLPNNKLPSEASYRPN